MMTLEQFYAELAGACRTWWHKGTNFGPRMRSAHNDCPIVAVANERNLGTTFYTSNPRIAAAAIDLPDSLATSIINAADHVKTIEPVVRQRLLEACNLVVPEISSVEQVNACQLECAT